MYIYNTYHLQMTLLLNLVVMAEEDQTCISANSVKIGIVSACVRVRMRVCIPPEMLEVSRSRFLESASLAESQRLTNKYYRLACPSLQK